MKLTQLLEGVHTSAACCEDVEIADVQLDSRRCAPGTLFVAVRGTAVDGHDFIEAAVGAGAAAVVCEKAVDSHSVPIIQVGNSAEALGVIASNFYGNPSQQLRLIGVTGTNGKTTIATLLYKLHRAFGFKAGLLSTVVNYVNDQAVEATHTTPDPLELNALLARMVECGCEYAFMEVSSHAVDQRRIAGLRFEGGVFTNLTRDHLDYHGTMDNYLKAKKRFFDDLPAEAFALSNADDRNGAVMLQNTKARKAFYSLFDLKDFKGQIIEASFGGMLLNIDNKEVWVPFVGRFNAQNLLAVYGAALLAGRDKDETLRLLSLLKPVNGRFEPIAAPKGYTAIVDYAHTPDALENVMNTINDILCGEGRLIVVVGCGGDRDKGKRPIMARVAASKSSVCILTSDNPRTEQPLDILRDMLAGLDDKQAARAVVIPDRAAAIAHACGIAERGDVVLVAGKGHEDYQIIGTTKHHFDDHEQIRKNF